MVSYAFHAGKQSSGGVYTVTGKKASEEEIDKMIETGESENIFQKAIMEQGRGHVSLQASLNHLAACICNKCPAYKGSCRTPF